MNSYILKILWVFQLPLGAYTALDSIMYLLTLFSRRFHNLPSRTPVSPPPYPPPPPLIPNPHYPNFPSLSFPTPPPFPVLPSSPSPITYPLLPRHTLTQTSLNVSPVLAFTSLFGFALLLRELHLQYKSVHRLQPPYYTLSNLYRAINEIICLSLFLHNFHRRQPGLYPLRIWGPMGASSVLYLTALTYGAWSWYHVRRFQHIDDSSFTVGTKATLEETAPTDPGMNLVPSKLLSSSRLTCRNNLIRRIVHWIHAPLNLHVMVIAEERGAWSKVKNLWRSALSVLGFFYILLKRVIGTFALVYLIPFNITEVIPNPQSIRVTDKQQDEWNYNRPKLGRQELVQNRPQRRLPSFAALRGRRLLVDTTQNDEEASRTTDLMSLHSVDETSHPTNQNVLTSRTTDDVLDRHLGPRYLCILDPTSPTGYTTQHVSTFAAHHGDGYPDYVFISYTRLQFYTTISGDPSLPSSINSRLQAAAVRDMNTLTQYAIRATQAAGIGAFWIDYECVRPESDESPDKSMEEVYRICDIVRACHSMSIIVGPRINYSDYSHYTPSPRSPNQEDEESPATKAQWLQDWGSRLWTVPEALLCPGEHRISLYTTLSPIPELVAKRNLPGRVWNDAVALRQLIDHYESSIHLTKLELISIALECLKRRQTEKRMKGDVAYALQGLLRQRPRVVQSDSDFQAFARLSLANDSDMLLERLLCLKLKDNRAPWHEMQDVWGAKLWDITPICQIVDVVENNTLTLGDAKCAMVNWAYLEGIKIEPTRPHSTYWVQLPLLTFVLTVGALTMSSFFQIGQRDSISFPFGIVFKIFLGLLMINAIILPWFLRKQYKAEIHKTQARFYGVAGHPELGKVEEMMFGLDQGRLQWMGGASDVADQQLLSTMTDPPIREENGDESGLRSFTLIDTCTLSAIPFEAELPPSVVLAGARTRGLVRMLLCSYDVSTDTLCKEAVLRMETVVLDRMPKLDRIRFTLKSAREDSVHT